MKPQLWALILLASFLQALGPILFFRGKRERYCGGKILVGGRCCGFEHEGCPATSLDPLLAPPAVRLLLCPSHRMLTLEDLPWGPSKLSVPIWTKRSRWTVSSCKLLAHSAFFRGMGTRRGSLINQKYFQHPLAENRGENCTVLVSDDVIFQKIIVLQA